MVLSLCNDPFSTKYKGPTIKSKKHHLFIQDILVYMDSKICWFLWHALSHDVEHNNFTRMCFYGSCQSSLIHSSQFSYLTKSNHFG